MSSEASLNFTFNVFNETQIDPSGRGSVAIAFRFVIILTDAILTIVGNLVGILLLCRTHEIPEGTKFFMLSLSSCDFCIGLLASLSLAPAYLGYWPYGNLYCRMSVLIVSIPCGVSISLLVTISLDRYFAIVWPLRYNSLATKKKAITVVVMIWIVTIVMNTPMWLHNKSDIRYVDEAVSCLLRWTDTNTVPMFVVCTFLGINVPIIVISFVYCRIISISRVQAMRIAASQLNPRNAAEHRPTNFQDNWTGAELNANVLRKAPKRPGAKNVKSIRMFCVVAFGFVIAWLPYCILTALVPTDINIPEWVEFMSLWLLMSHSWWNVMIYLVMNKNIRRSASRLFRTQE